MATILESGIPATIEVITNGTQHGVASQASGILSTYLPGPNWQIAVTALLILIAYDQCMAFLQSYELQQQELQQLLTNNSLIHQTERLNSWAHVQDSLHGTILASHLPKV